MKSQIKSVFAYRICPFCGGNVEYAGISSGHIFPAINTGQMYVCRECGYQGGFCFARVLQIAGRCRTRCGVWSCRERGSAKDDDE